MVKKLKMGFTGFGFIGPVHRDAVGTLCDIAVPYAVADDDPAKQKEGRRQGLKVYSKAEELIADPKVDVIHITGPDEYHAQWALAAMKAKKRVVVCEKPMTVTLEESVKVLEAAQRYERNTGGVFMTNINYMGHALPRAAREMRQKGFLGRIEAVDGRYEQDWLMDPNIWNWRLAGDMCASKDILPHLISAAYFMGGIWPTKLIASSRTIIEDRQMPKQRTDAFAKGQAGDGVVEKVPVKVKSDLYTAILCDFNNGAQGRFLVTQYFAGRQNFWEITLAGSERRATWNQIQPNVLEIGQVLIKDPTRPPKVEDVRHIANLSLINNPGYLAAAGYNDAASYSPYPGEHPAGHLDAFARNFRTAYLVATGQMKREEAVIPGATIGFACVAVADAVRRSRKAGRKYVNVDYKGIDLPDCLGDGKL